MTYVILPSRCSEHYSFNFKNSEKSASSNIQYIRLKFEINKSQGCFIHTRFKLLIKFIGTLNIDK